MIGFLLKRFRWVSLVLTASLPHLIFAGKTLCMCCDICWSKIASIVTKYVKIQINDVQSSHGNMRCCCCCFTLISVYLRCQLFSKYSRSKAHNSTIFSLSQCESCWFSVCLSRCHFPLYFSRHSIFTYFMLLYAGCFRIVMVFFSLFFSASHLICRWRKISLYDARNFLI